ncbi:MAG: phosphonate ABC transporter ATP-binding protein [Chloroflexi bacterium]|nr:phosphonate ABC transporter ATP-binding protein [Chloroflexota bacterium]
MLEIQNVRVVYPNGTEALKSVSMSVKQDEIVAIIGRSGAGKSTLLRCINGLQPVTAGSITLDGQEVTQMDKAELRMLWRQIGFIWQEYNLVGRLPAMTNVLTGRLGYNSGFANLFGYFGSDHRAIALRSLERVNMLHRAKFRADRLSGGEKQRVSIARALSQEPKLLLADEPVASLDPELSWQVMEDLARVAREERVPTLINIHHVDLAKAFTDRLIGIAEGVVVFEGRPDELDDAAMDRIYRFDKPEARETADLHPADNPTHAAEAVPAVATRAELPVEVND